MSVTGSQTVPPQSPEEFVTAATAALERLSLASGVDLNHPQGIVARALAEADAVAHRLETSQIASDIPTLVAQASAIAATLHLMIGAVTGNGRSAPVSVSGSGYDSLGGADATHD